MSIENKFNKVFKLIAFDSNLASQGNLIDEILSLQDYLLNFENLELSSDFLKAMSHLDRFDLEFGGQTKTAKKLESYGQELASQGFISEPETLGDLEDSLYSLYNQYHENQRQYHKALELLDGFYLLACEVLNKHTRKQKQAFGFNIFRFLKLQLLKLINNLSLFVHFDFKTVIKLFNFRVLITLLLFIANVYLLGVFY